MNHCAAASCEFDLCKQGYNRPLRYDVYVYEKENRKSGEEGQNKRQQQEQQQRSTSQVGVSPRDPIVAAYIGQCVDWRRWNRATSLHSIYIDRSVSG
ncbi:hypothetical protein T01_14303 [Trichinella spiralis]|uniref:Uncharacterized protein n=1 Tax=Trichinella spiralis TaxID=6334 RepID=A0A0V1BRM4_TRISP|nr:hypothetical protein T01_14303 [Trichinella spiralis]